MKEIFQVPEHMQKMLAVLDENRQRLERAMSLGPLAGSFSEEHSAAAAELSRASATLGREMRNWLGATKTSLDKLTPGRKMQVFVEWAQGLPISIRRDLYTVLAGLEGERPDGLKVSVSDRFAEPRAAAVELEDPDVGA